MCRSSGQGGTACPAAPPRRKSVLAALLDESLRRWDIHPESDPFAVVIDIRQPFDFEALTRLARGLAEFAQSSLPPGRPLVAVIQQDYAQVLGQTVKTMIPDRPLLVIDQVGLEEGDYIDIGAPLMDGRVVPVSVKTLIFYHDLPR